MIIQCKLRGAMTSSDCHKCYVNNEAGFSENHKPASRVLCKKENGGEIVEPDVTIQTTTHLFTQLF